MRKPNQMIQITHWTPKSSSIRTNDDVVPYEQWLIKERDRVLSDPTRQAEIRYKDNDCALYVNNVGRRE